MTETSVAGFSLPAEESLAACRKRRREELIYRASRGRCSRARESLYLLKMQQDVTD